jgi:hypothetical protein
MRGELTSLIPSLNSGSYGIEDDGKVESPWLVPATSLFKLKFVAFAVFEAFNALETQWVLCQQSPALKKRENIC